MQKASLSKRLSSKVDSSAKMDSSEKKEFRKKAREDFLSKLGTESRSSTTQQPEKKMDNSEKKQTLLKARAEFLNVNRYTSDSGASSTQKFDQKITRIRHLSGTDHNNEREDEEFRKRSSSYGNAVSPNLSRIKELLKVETKQAGSWVSKSGKSSPSSDFTYGTPIKINPPKDATRGNSRLPVPSHSRQTEADSPRIPGIQDDDYYMRHKSRGKALIFNHVNFQDEELPEREGAMKDVENLTKTLLLLGFLEHEIEVLTDLSYSDITKTLESVSQEDHTNNDLLMLFVLTHGDKNDMIHAYDHEYQVSKLWKPFTAEKCKTLAGKPKIFFIVACRGDSMDAGAQIAMISNRRKPSINTETDAALMGPVVSYTIPVWADFLTIYSTVQGYFSYRDSDDGTWYIKALCEEIKNVKNSDKKSFSFTDLLVKVNRKVAISYETYNDNPAFHKKKQCPFISSTLTRLIQFENK